MFPEKEILTDGPTDPLTPGGPGFPAGPSYPCGPGSPLGPLGPVGPCGPGYPGVPGKPTRPILPCAVIRIIDCPCFLSFINGLPCVQDVLACLATLLPRGFPWAPAGQWPRPIQGLLAPPSNPPGRHLRCIQDYRVVLGFL